MQKRSREHPSLVLMANGVWAVAVDNGRTTRHISLRTTDQVVAAERFARWLKKQVDGEGDITIKVLLKRYELERAAFAGDYPRIASVLARISSKIGKIEIPPEFAEARQVVSAAIAQYAVARSADGVGMTNINKELRYLRAALRWGQDTGAIPLFPISLKFVSPSAEQPPIKILTPDQLRAVIDIAARTRMRDEPPGRLTRMHRFFMIAYWTGARRRSIERLLWEHVNLEPGNETIDFRPYYYGTRRKRGALTAVPKALASFLRIAYEQRINDMVLDSTAHLGPHIKRVFVDAGIPDGSAHWLRHTRITALIAKGLTAEQAAAVVGNGEEVARKVYNHLAHDVSRLRALLD